MNNKPKIHPFVIESHAKAKVWNEYIIEYFGLKLDKKIGLDYKAMVLKQGSIKLFDKFDFQLTRTGNAYMHKHLRAYLEDYMKHFQKIKDFENEPEFKPPKG